MSIYRTGKFIDRLRSVARLAKCVVLRNEASHDRARSQRTTFPAAPGVAKFSVAALWSRVRLFQPATQRHAQHAERVIADIVKVKDVLSSADLVRRLERALARAKRAEFGTYYICTLQALCLGWSKIAKHQLQQWYRALIDASRPELQVVPDGAMRLCVNRLTLLWMALENIEWDGTAFDPLNEPPRFSYQDIEELLLQLRRVVLQPLGFSCCADSPWSMLPERLYALGRASRGEVLAVETPGNPVLDVDAAVMDENDAAEVEEEVAAPPVVVGEETRIVGPATPPPALDPSAFVVGDNNPYRKMGSGSACISLFIGKVMGNRLGLPSAQVVERELTWATAALAHADWQWPDGVSSTHTESATHARLRLCVIAEAIKAEHEEPHRLLAAIHALAAFQSSNSKKVFVEWMKVMCPRCWDSPLVAALSRIESAYDQLARLQRMRTGAVGPFADFDNVELLDRTAVQTALRLYHGDTRRRSAAVRVLAAAANRMVELLDATAAVRLRALAAFVQWKLNLPPINPEAAVAECTTFFDGDSAAAIRRWMYALEPFAALKPLQDAALLLRPVGASDEQVRDQAVQVFVGEFAAFLQRFATCSHNRSDVILEHQMIPDDFFADCADRVAIEQRVIATTVHLLRDDDDNVRLLALRVARAAVERVNMKEGIALQLFAELLAHHVGNVSPALHDRVTAIASVFLRQNKNGYAAFATWIESLHVLPREGFDDFAASPLAPLEEILVEALPRHPLPQRDALARARVAALHAMESAARREVEEPRVMYGPLPTTHLAPSSRLSRLWRIFRKSLPFVRGG